MKADYVNPQSPQSFAAFVMLLLNDRETGGACSMALILQLHFLHQVFKQKVKHVLCEHQNVISGLKADAVVLTGAMQKEQEELEAEIHQEQEAISVDMQDVESEKLAWEIELVCATHQLLDTAPLKAPTIKTALILAKTQRRTEQSEGQRGETVCR